MRVSLGMLTGYHKIWYFRKWTDSTCAEAVWHCRRGPVGVSIHGPKPLRIHKQAIGAGAAVVGLNVISVPVLENGLVIDGVSEGGVRIRVAKCPADLRDMSTKFPPPFRASILPRVLGR